MVKDRLCMYIYIYIILIIYIYTCICIYIIYIQICICIYTYVYIYIYLYLYIYIYTYIFIYIYLYKKKTRSSISHHLLNAFQKVPLGLSPSPRCSHQRQDLVVVGLAEIIPPPEPGARGHPLSSLDGDCFMENPHLKLG